MNWYFKFSSTRDDYLKSLGADDNMVQFINSFDESNAHFLVNEFRKNPSLTIDNLYDIIVEVKAKIVDPYLATEYRAVENLPEEMKKWALVTFRKVRKGLLIPYQKWPGNLFDIYTTFLTKLQQIKDWYNNIQPDIASYSAEQAIDASDEWHLAMAGRGEGKYYQEQNIVYGPEWKDDKGNVVDKFNGWTIQEVKTQNDLNVEGNKMNNCVGNYYNAVDNGESRIFSLRDPSNNPHITIETDFLSSSRTGPIMGEVQQIQGNSNRVPDKAYKAMIKHWVMFGNGPQQMSDDSDVLTDTIGDLRYYPNLSELSRRLDSFDLETEYGIKLKLDTSHISDLFDICLRSLDDYSQSTYGEYTGDRGIGGELVALAVMVGDDGIKELLEKIQSEEEKLDYPEIEGLNYPNEEDFETEEDFAKAEKTYFEQEGEYINHTFPIGWFNDLHEKLNDELGKVRGITVQEWWNSQNKMSHNQKLEKENINLVSNWYSKLAQAEISLWLDDERDPTNPDIQNGFGSLGNEIWVKTAPEAIDILSGGNVTSVSLDHDLGEPEAEKGSNLPRGLPRGFEKP